jgi:hypothetical protein
MRTPAHASPYKPPMKTILAFLVASVCLAQTKLADGPYFPVISISSLPAAAAASGKTYYVLTTDCSTVSTSVSQCYSNGTAWSLVGGSGGGGGGTGNAAAGHTPAFSSSLALTCAATTGGTKDSFVVGQLTGAITLSISNCTPYQEVSIDLQQVASGSPAQPTWSSGFSGGCDISQTVNAHTVQTFYVNGSGTLTPEAACVASAGPGYSGEITRSSVVTPGTANTDAMGVDSTSHIPFSIDPTGADRVMVKELSSGNIRCAGGSNADDTACASSNVISLFSGCSGTLYLGADGACHSGTGGGASPAGTLGAFQTYLTSSSFSGTVVTGIVKGNGTSVPSPAAASDVVALFSTCSGTQYLGADGACHSAGTSAGTVNTISHFFTPPLSTGYGNWIYGGTGVAASSCSTASTDACSIAYQQSATGSAIVQWSVPAQWTSGAPTVTIWFYGSGGGGNTVQFAVSAGCLQVPGGTFSYNTAQNFTSTPTTGATVYTLTSPSLTMTGCAAGSVINYKITRIDANAGAAYLIGVQPSFLIP